MKKIIVIILIFTMTIGLHSCFKNHDEMELYEKKFYNNQELEFFLERLFLKNDVPIIVGDIKDESILKLEYYSYRITAFNIEKYNIIENLYEIMDNSTSHEFETCYKDISDRFTVMVRISSNYYASTTLEPSEQIKIVNEDRKIVTYDGGLKSTDIVIFIIFNDTIDYEVAEEVKDLIFSNLKLYERLDFYDECLRPEPFC